MRLNFTAEDSDRANDEWGANCGPHSIAAALWLDLSTVRDLMPDFEGKRYTTPTMIEATLVRAGIKFSRSTGHYTSQLCEGINRIQWEGTWLNKGVPFAAAYQRTHWIAYAPGRVFCTATPGFGWKSLRDWLVGMRGACEEIKSCTGWHVTHYYAFDVLAKEVR